MPPDLPLLSTLTGSNYLCLELISIVPKVFEPLKFYYIGFLCNKIFKNVAKIAGSLKGRFLEFQMYHDFAHLLSKFSKSDFYKKISKFQ